MPADRLVDVGSLEEDGGVEHAPSAEELLERFGTTAPDQVRLAVVTRIDKPSPG